MNSEQQQRLRERMHAGGRNLNGGERISENSSGMGVGLIVSSVLVHVLSDGVSELTFTSDFERGTVFRFGFCTSFA
jgi:hypothetical protein